MESKYGEEKNAIIQESLERLSHKPVRLIPSQAQEESSHDLDVSSEIPEFISMENARYACRVDGYDNDPVLYPIKRAAEAYVYKAVGPEYLNDPRVIQAALIMIQISYRPEEDAQGNLKAHMTALLRQMHISF